VALPVALVRALADRYTLERKLGQGGMATVYLAHDLRNNRPVALKVLRPELAAILGAERFLKEIETTANLQHPHILPLFDSGKAVGRLGGSAVGESGGVVEGSLAEFLFYVMPYVEEESLRARLEREKQLPLDVALQIAAEVADALAYAHRQGVIHRDIKPENILLLDGHALVADFGIALAVTEGGGDRLTETGLTLGTPQYMSPEQATGERQLDGRTDIYSLGAVLYEMLAGEPPYTGSTAQAIIAKRLREPLPSLSTLREVPPAVESLVARALARAPADRFPDAASMAVTLRRAADSSPARRASRLPLAVVAAGLLVLVVGVLLNRQLRAPAASHVGVRSVAVLPLRNLGDTSDDYVAEGVTEEIGGTLVRLPGLVVRPGSAVDRDGPGGRDLAALGQRLAAAYLIDGTLRREGRRVRVNVDLVQLDPAATLWSRHFDVSDSSLFAVQDSIAAQVATAFSLELAAAGATSRAGRGARDPVTHDLTLKARHLIEQMTPAGAEGAVAVARRAVEADSTNADAWVTLARAYDRLSQHGGSTPVELLTGWRQAVDRAIDLDSLNGDAYASRAVLRYCFEWDYPGAYRDFQRAIALNPGSAEALLNYAQALNVTGFDDSAVVVMRRALDLNPSDPFFFANLAIRLIAVRRFDDAVDAARRSLALDSTQWVASLALAQVADLRGSATLAAQTAAAWGRGKGGAPIAQGYRAYFFGRAGRRAEAIGIIRELEASSRDDYLEQVHLAQAYLGLSDTSRALSLLEASARNREPDLVWKVGYGDFRLLEGSPRYAALLKRLDLAGVRR
jgi:serine/threonine-protein kinase